MASNAAAGVAAADWRTALPTLASRLVTLRELAADDLGPLAILLSAADASRFGIDAPDAGVAAHLLIDRAAGHRASGLAFTYAITLGATRALVGVVQVRRLDPAFEGAECDCTIAPAARGTGVFLEAARLAGSFAFAAVGAHRLEARVLLQNGRGNGAMRKLGAVQEGVLRRSVRHGDDYVDQVLWSMLENDWGDHWVSIAPRVH
jgi:RimJ/RimL family protein N-acetyltransferase